MKQYLPLFAMAFVAANAQAGSWTAPTVKTQDAYQLSTAESDTIYQYLYHAGRKQFLNKGATWGTHAALDSTDLAAAPYAIFQDEAGYRLFSSTAANQGLLFRNAALSVYTDYNNNANSTIYWDIVAQGNGLYRLMTAQTDPTWGEGGTQINVDVNENAYLLGWNPDGQDLNSSGTELGTNQAVYMLDPTLENIEVDWQFVSAEDYAQYQALKGLYDQLNIAEEAGVATGSAEAVYNNEAATVEEIEAAVAALKEAIANKAYAGASEDNPVEITDLVVVNAGFDGNADGWTNDGFAYDGGTYPNSTGTADNGGYTFIGAMQAWISSASHLADKSVSQVISNLPAGKYTVTADVICQHGTDMPSGVYLFAKGVTESTTEVVHDQEVWDAAVAASANNQLIEHPVVEIVHAGGDLEIGLKTVNTNCNWVVFDNFSLTYYGPTADNPYLLALRDAITTANVYTDTDTYYYSENGAAELADAINAAEALMASSASDEELTAATDALNAAVDAVKADIAAYETLADYCEQVGSDRDKYEAAGLVDMAGSLADLYDESIGHYGDRDLTPEEIQALIDSYEETFNALLAEAMKDATVDNPIEITSLYLKNADFSDGVLDPWVNQTGVLVYSNDSFPNSSCNVAEINENESFSKAIAGWVSSATHLGDEQVSQTITDLPAGSYILSCSMVAQHGADMPEGVYLFSKGSLETKTLCAHDATLWEELVAAGTTNQLIMHPKHVFYHTGGDLELGVRLVSTNCNWVYADKFTLSYAGESAEAMYDALQALVVQAQDLLDVASAVIDADNMLNEALAAAEDCSDTDMDQIQSTMEQLQAAIDYASTVSSALSELRSVYTIYADYLAANVESDEPTFIELLETVGTALEDEEFESVAQIESFIEQLQLGYATYVQYPYLETSSEENPGNITAAIINPGFEGVTGTPGAEYWDITRTGGGADYQNGVYEGYNNDSFDFSQTIQGLAPGYYKIRVQAFYRAGTNAVNAETFAATPDSTQNVLLYGNEYSTPIKNQIERGEESGAVGAESGEVTISYGGNEEYYVPNTRVAVAAYFGLDLYWNELECYVGEDGILKLGLKKDVHVASDWCPFDNFELYYLGTEAPTAVERVNVDSEAGIVSTRFYSLDGMLLARPIKGVNIVKTTLSDGTIRVNKILVR